jgi:hypothetical protein
MMKSAALRMRSILAASYAAQVVNFRDPDKAAPSSQNTLPFRSKPA